MRRPQLKKGDKTRAFVVTQWNLDCDYNKLIEKGQIRFIAYGDEVCPETGKEHHQAYVYFWNPRGISNRCLNVIGNMFGPTHCRVAAMRGKFQENDAYCSKETSLKKFGNEPEQGARGDLDETKNMILEGSITPDEVAVNDPHMYHMYGRTMRVIEDVATRRKYRTFMTKGYWLTGSPSETGEIAFEGYDPNKCYQKPLADPWWDKYNGQEVVILHGFNGELKLHELLRMVDRFPFDVPRRGRDPHPFLAKMVIITCRDCPDDVYDQLKSKSAWRSRPKIATEFYEKFLFKLEQKWSEGNIRPLIQKRKADEMENAGCCDSSDRGPGGHLNL